MQFEIIQSDNGFAIILDGFSTKNESARLISQINGALQIKKDWDNAVAESESIDQSIYKERMSVDLDLVDIPTYNKLTELANLKGMNPKDVLDMIIQNEIDDQIGMNEDEITDGVKYETPTKVELIAQ